MSTNNEQLILELTQTRKRLAETIRECNMLREENTRLLNEFREFIRGAYKALEKAYPSQTADSHATEKSTIQDIRLWPVSQTTRVQ